MENNSYWVYTWFEGFRVSVPGKYTTSEHEAIKYALREKRGGKIVRVEKITTQDITHKLENL